MGSSGWSFARLRLTVLAAILLFLIVLPSRSSTPAPKHLPTHLSVLCCKHGERLNSEGCFSGELAFASGVPYPCQPYIAFARLPLLSPTSVLGTTPPSTNLSQYCQRIPGGVPRTRPRRVYDLFTFSEEFTALKTRLDTLHGVVDMSVVSECAVAVSGISKPLTFNESRATIFAKFDRIRHFAIAEDLGRRHRPEVLGPAGQPQSSQDREAFQKDVVHLGLFDAAPDDVVIIGDEGAFPSRATVSLLKWCDFEGVLGLRTRQYFYHWNCEAAETDSLRAMQVRDFHTKSFTDARTSALSGAVDLAGFHTSYFFSTAREVEAKLRSLSHHEMGASELTDVRHLQRSLAICAVHRPGGHVLTLNRDVSHFPEPVMENPQRYYEFLHEDLTNAIQYCLRGRPSKGFTQSLWVGRAHRVGCCPDSKIKVLSALLGPHKGCPSRCTKTLCFTDYTKHFQNLCDGKLRCSSPVVIPRYMAAEECNVTVAIP
eukprot:RCo055204